MRGGEEGTHCSPLLTHGPEQSASGGNVSASGNSAGWAASLVLLSEASQITAQDS